MSSIPSADQFRTPSLNMLGDALIRGTGLMHEGLPWVLGSYSAARGGALDVYTKPGEGLFSVTYVALLIAPIPGFNTELMNPANINRLAITAYALQQLRRSYFH